MTTTPVAGDVRVDDTSTPYPQAADPKREWYVEEAFTPSVDFKRAVVAVPTGVTPVERQTRNFTMAQVRFSPPNPKLPPGLPRVAYDACETFRVHRRASNINVRTNDIPYYDPSMIDGIAANFAKAGPLIAASALVDAFMNYNDRVVVRAAVDKAYENDPKTYQRIMRGVNKATTILTKRTNPGPAVAVTAAEAMQWAITPPTPPKPEGEPDPDANTKPQSNNQPATPSYDDVAESVLTSDKERQQSTFDMAREELSKKMEQTRQETPKATGWEFLDTPHPGWGDMAIVDDIPMPHRLVGRMKAPGLVPRDQGAVFKYYQRYTADKAVFAGKIVRDGGASILIDTSGSMGLTIADVADIISVLPGSIIGTYAGGSNKGELYIVARNGMWVEKENLTPNYGGNCVDGPALRWLADQKGPRIWVSDGYVTGRNDASNIELLAEAQGLCLRHRILRLHDIEAAKEWATSKGFRR